MWDNLKPLTVEIKSTTIIDPIKGYDSTTSHNSEQNSASSKSL